MLNESIFGLSQNAYEIVFTQFSRRGNDGDTAEKLGYHAKLMQVLRHHLSDKIGLTLIKTLSNMRVKPDTLLTDTIRNNLIETNKGSTTDKEDVGGVNVDKFLLRMLAAACWRHARFSSLQNLQERLLNSLTGNISGNGEVFCLTSNFVNLVDVNNANLRALNVSVSRRDEFQKNVFNILANITGFRKRSGVSNGKRNFQKAGKCLSKQGLAGTGRSKQQNVRFCNLNVLIALSRLIIA